MTTAEQIAANWADLRAGRITAEQARKRNREIKAQAGAQGFTLATVGAIRGETR